MALDAYAPRPLRFPAWAAYLGPAVAVSIGYIDPGNWASDLAAGAFGCALLWVVLAANVVACVVQIAVTRVTLAYGSDLGSLIAQRWPRARGMFWATFQGAAIATDVAEFAGIVLGAQLLFGIGTLAATGLGIVTVFVLLGVAARKSMRALDVMLLSALLGVTFVFLKLAFGGAAGANAILHGALVPTVPGTAAVLVIVAIVGATVMPHNLFLHSSLVADRLAGAGAVQRRSLRGIFAAETLVALGVATLVNLAIIIVGANLHGSGNDIQSAFAALRSTGGFNPALLFGLGLLISGVAATMTSTLAGDYICRSFGGARISPLLRRAVTIGPAAAALVAGANVALLLLWSQVLLCLILPVALVPIVLLLRDTAGAAAPRERRFLHLTHAAVAVCIFVDVLFLVTSVV